MPFTGYLDSTTSTCNTHSLNRVVSITFPSWLHSVRNPMGVREIDRLQTERARESECKREIE